MVSEILRDNLSVLLEGLQENFDRMETYQEVIPQIEMDIFLRDIQKVYESTIQLNKQNKELKKDSNKDATDQNITKKNETIYHVVELPQTEKEEIKEIKTEKEVVVSNTEKTPQSPNISIDDVLKEISNQNVQDQQEKEDKIFTSSKERKAYSSYQNEKNSDLFENSSAKQEILDLNRKLAEERKGSSIGERLQQKRIDSLKAVIGLNDKFEFVKELFDGDSKKYEDVIYTLNNFKKLEEAMQYFSTLKYRFNWDEEQDSLEKLIHMIEKKYESRNISYT